MTGEGAVTQVEPASSAIQVTPWLSVERLLYGVALLLGIWLRFWRLGSQPLSPWEASNSWPAWLVAHGLHVTDAPVPTSALYYGLQWLTFWIGVNSDSGARFVSAVAGVALIVLPWWWRGFLGRRVALILAFLLAIDSWTLGFSRLADGAMLSIAVAMLSLVSCSQVIENPTSDRWKRIAATSLGILLVSGPMGWNLVPVVVAFGWLMRSGLSDAGMMQRRWLFWVIGSAIVGATLFLARVDGLSFVASGMSVWLSQFDGKSAGSLLPMLTEGYDFAWSWLRLWSDAAALLPLGAGGVLILAQRAQRDSHSQRSLQPLLVFLLGWVAWGILLCILPGRSPLALPVVGLPLMILSAYFIDAIITNIPSDVDWREISAIVVTLAILAISGIFWLAALLATGAYDPVMAQAALVILGLTVAILVAFSVWANRRDALWLAASLLSVLLIVVYFRSSWKLNFGNVTIEPSGWQAMMAHPEVRILVDDMEKLSSHNSGDPYQLPVQVQVAPTVSVQDQVIPARPDPVVGWQLRNMRNLTWVTSPNVTPDSEPMPLVLTPAIGDQEAAPLDLPDQYAGSRYHVDSMWLPESVGSHESVATEASFGQAIAEKIQPWWRWFIYREATKSPVTRDVILWAPVSLSGD